MAWCLGSFDGCQILAWVVRVCGFEESWLLQLRNNRCCLTGLSEVSRREAAFVGQVSRALGARQAELIVGRRGTSKPGGGSCYQKKADGSEVGRLALSS